MCIVPINKEIMTKQDVYFLVGSIINRQTEVFTKESVFECAKENLRGSQFKISNEELKSIIDQEFDILYRNGFIAISGNNYINKDSYEYA